MIKLIQSQNGFGFGEIQIESDLLSGGQRVDHIGDGADPVQRIKTVQSLGRIGHTDGDLVAFADAHSGQTPGGSVDAGHKMGVGGLFALKNVGGVMGILPGGVAQ